MAERKRGASLRLKLMITSLLLLVVAIVLFATMHTLHTLTIIDASARRTTDMLRSSLRRSGSAHLQLLINSCKVALEHGNPATLQTIVRHLSRQDSLISGAGIVDPSGTIRAHSQSKRVGARLSGLKRELFEAGRERVRTDTETNVLIFSAPVTTRSSAGWFVYLAYSLEPLAAAKATSDELHRSEIEVGVRNTVLLGGLVLLLGAAIAYFQSVRISRPLSALASQANKIASGDLLARVHIRSHDEIGLLGSQFNIMADHVQLLMQEIAEKATIVKEIEVARAIQHTLVPENPSVDLAGLDLAGYFRPAGKCGGDWWYYYRLNDGRILVLIGDVTGHGLPAVMITAVVKGAATNMVSVTRGQIKLDELLRELDVAVNETARGKLAMTCFASLFNPDDRTLTYANAGHTFPYLMQADSGKSIVLSVRGGMLGDLAGESHEIHQTALSPNDMLIWYTDGIVEGESEKGEPFGQKRFVSTIRSRLHLSAEDARDEIVERIHRFYGNVPQGDDITLVIGKVG